MCSSYIVGVFILGLYTTYTSAWELAVSHDGGIQFESASGELLGKAALQSKPGAMCYDPAERQLFYGDTSGDSSIRALDLSGHSSTNSDQLTAPSYLTPTRSVVPRHPGDTAVQGLAYDPLTRTLFWTEGSLGRRVLRYTLPEMEAAVESAGETYETGKREVLFTFEEKMPYGIAVDVCRRKLYWTNANHRMPSIEQSNLDGSEHKVLVDSDLFIPVAILVDQASSRLYWADDSEGVYFRIESAALDGTDRRVIYHGKDHQPSGLAISASGHIFWTDLVYKALWSLDVVTSPNESQQDETTKPTIVQKFHEDPMGVVVGLTVAQAYEHDLECSAVVERLQNRSEPLAHLDVIQCLHGLPSPDGGCLCASGYAGLHCELPLCHNYCLGGGTCSVDPRDGGPVCRCPTNREGLRCEGTKGESGKTRSAVMMTDEAARGSAVDKGTWQSDNESGDDRGIMTATSLFKPTAAQCLATSPVSVLGTLSCLLLLTTCVLTWKLYHSTRRPRIHKRIIVNKNQPLSTRPSPDGSNAPGGGSGGNQQRSITAQAQETCEITIENCCNMNICETPCFDPVSYREPTEKYRSKKEEKKNLLGGMENGDDMY